MKKQTKSQVGAPTTGVVDMVRQLDRESIRKRIEQRLGPSPHCAPIMVPPTARFI